MAETKTFEEQLAELEEIVRRLEQGRVSLDESLSLFERGVKLTKSCQKILDTAEKRVKILVSEDGEIVEKDFANEN